jgi:hypothetical protein
MAWISIKNLNMGNLRIIARIVHAIIHFTMIRQGFVSFGVIKVAAHALRATLTTTVAITLRLPAKFSPHIPDDRWPSHDGRHLLPEPLFNYRPPRHQAETHAVVQHREATAGEMY